METGLTVRALALVKSGDLPETYSAELFGKMLGVPTRAAARALVTLSRRGVVAIHGRYRAPCSSLTLAIWGGPLGDKPASTDTEESDGPGRPYKIMEIPAEDGRRRVCFGDKWKPTPLHDGTARPWRGYASGLARIE